MNKVKCTILFLAISLSVTGCSVVQSLGDYVNENPIFADIATRQAVGRYIAAGSSPEEQEARAVDVDKTVTKALIFLEGNPTATVDTLLAVVDTYIDWGSLSVPDRLLVQDILALVEAELRKHEDEASGISDTARIAIRDLLETAISAAAWYL